MLPYRLPGSCATILVEDVLPMIFEVVADPIPLQTDADGVVRVGGTRVTLDTVVAAFADGATAEERAQRVQMECSAAVL